MTADAAAPLTAEDLHHLPDDGRRYELAFVRADRVPTGDERRRCAELAPDRAVEVASPSDSAREIADKAARWPAAGVRLVRVVWPARQAVDVYEAGHEAPRALGANDTLDGGEVLPGFEVPVAELFT
jgi:Uma2 family endonuclease